MVTTPAVGIAAFTVDCAGRRSEELQPGARLRGASVLKPLLFWVGATAGPFATDGAAWESIARPAITASDNDATAALWSQVGEEDLLDALRDRTGVAWRTDGDGEHPSLRVMVTAGELAHAYASFASDDGVVAEQVRCWMREVPAEQTLGVRRVAYETLEVPERSVGVKCGWFGVERAHAVVLAELPGRVLGAAVTTFRPPDAASRTAARAAIGSDDELVAAHDRFSGQVLRSATRRALLAAARL